MKHHNLSAGAEQARRNIIKLRAKKMRKSAAMSRAMTRRWAAKRDELAPPAENEEEGIEVAAGDSLLDGLPEAIQVAFLSKCPACKCPKRIDFVGVPVRCARCNHELIIAPEVYGDREVRIGIGTRWSRVWPLKPLLDAWHDWPFGMVIAPTTPWQWDGVSAPVNA